MPARCTRMRTSLIPMRGFSTSSSHRPGSLLLLTSAFIWRTSMVASNHRAEAMLRYGGRGLEGLLVQDAQGTRKLARGARNHLLQHARQRPGAQVHHQLVAARGGCQQVSVDGRLLPIGADAGLDIAAGRAIEDLQMRDRRRGAGKVF